MILQTLLEARGIQRHAVGVGGHLARQQFQPRRRVGQCVSLAILLHLQPVFQIAQEGVGGRQARVFAIGQKSLVPQAEEGEHRAAVAHPLLASAVQALQTLHQKLDVADPARRQLDVQAAGRAALGSQFFADALARFAYRFDGPEVEGALIDQRLHKLQQGGAGLALSRRDARLDQHLLLPVARAFTVVGARAFLGDGDLAQGPVRAQPQVHAIALPLRRICREQCRVLVGHLLVEFLVREHGGTVGLPIAAVDEHQVDIGAVVQFLAAQLAERNHGKTAQAAVFQPRLAMTRHQLRANSPVGNVEDGVRQVGQLFRDVRERGRAQDVAEQNAQQLTPPEAREIHRRRHACAQKAIQSLAIVLAREHAVERARRGDMQQALRVAQRRF